MKTKRLLGALLVMAMVAFAIGALGHLSAPKADAADIDHGYPAAVGAVVDSNVTTTNINGPGFIDTSQVSTDAIIDGSSTSAPNGFTVSCASPDAVCASAVTGSSRNAPDIGINPSPVPDANATNPNYLNGSVERLDKLLDTTDGVLMPLTAARSATPDVVIGAGPAEASVTNVTGLPPDQQLSLEVAGPNSCCSPVQAPDVKSIIDPNAHVTALIDASASNSNTLYDVPNSLTATTPALGPPAPITASAVPIQAITADQNVSDRNITGPDPTPKLAPSPAAISAGGLKWPILTSSRQQADGYTTINGTNDAFATRPQPGDAVIAVAASLFTTIYFAIAVGLSVALFAGYKLTAFATRAPVNALATATGSTTKLPWRSVHPQPTALTRRRTLMAAPC